MPKSPSNKRSRKGSTPDDKDEFPLEKEEKTKDVISKEKKKSSNDNRTTNKSKTEPSQSSLLRDLRQKRRVELRSKTTGTGLKIELSGKSSSTLNQRVVFGDDDIEAPEVSREGGADENGEVVQSADVTDNNNDGDDGDDDDDDDDVEVMKSQVARSLVMEQRAMERESEQLTIQIKSRKKKKKKSKISESVKDEPSRADANAATEASDAEEDDDELDPSFFAQVDAQLAEQRKVRREEKKRQSQEQHVKPKGRHTTFVSAEDDHTLKPIPVDQTMELVVLGTDSNEQGPEMNLSLFASKPSQTAQLFSKSRLITNHENIYSTNHANKKKRQEKNAKKKTSKEVTSWKRAKKMNEFAIPGVRSREARRQGRAAALFVVK